MIKSNSHYRAAMTIGALLATAIISGCGYQHGERFVADNTLRSTGELAEAQCASGAKEDAMLYDMNFHGEKLNSLGQGKLDLIVKGTPDGDPVVVYLNMPHDQVAVRQLAVTDYLKTNGISETKIVVAEGPNLNKTTPTAYNLSGVYKKDGNGSYDGDAAIDTPSAGGGGAAGPAAH
jgi:hypothetical protein